jgi:hypothetical protein
MESSTILTLNGCLIIPRILRAVDDVVVSASKLTSVDASPYEVAVLPIGIFDRSVDLYKHKLALDERADKFKKMSAYFRIGKRRMIEGVVSVRERPTNKDLLKEVIFIILLTRVHGDSLRSLKDEP